MFIEHLPNQLGIQGYRTFIWSSLSHGVESTLRQALSPTEIYIQTQYLSLEKVSSPD